MPKRNAAWIGLASGGAHIPCVLWDISEGGARIAAPRANVLPIAFNLFLSKDEKSRRVCRVVWRNDSYMGVQFVQGASAEDVLEAGALRRLPKIMVAGSAAPKGDATTLLLPGYGAAFLEKPEPRRIPISSIAGIMVFMLVAATALLLAAGLQGDAPWAQQLCASVGNFCHHPEWTGAAAALLAAVYLAIRGMEL